MEHTGNNEKRILNHLDGIEEEDGATQPTSAKPSEPTTSGNQNVSSSSSSQQSSSTSSSTSEFETHLAIDNIDIIAASQQEELPKSKENEQSFLCHLKNSSNKWKKERTRCLFLLVI